MTARPSRSKRCSRPRPSDHGQSSQISKRTIRISTRTPPPMYTAPPFVVRPTRLFPSLHTNETSRFAGITPRVPLGAGELDEGGRDMPPRGVKKGTKRARQYEHIKESVREQGASEGEAEEIAARTVNKERARSGEARESSALSRSDISSGRRGGIRSHRKSPRGRTRDQLYEEAKERNIRGRSRMTKAELQRALGGRH